MDKEPILSICIASYNHGKDLYEKIKMILEANRNTEVVVSDNASTDETDNLLKSIKNDNFKYLRNETNLGPTANYIKTLDNADGKYAMFLTDKDSIDVKNLNAIIEILQNNDFSMGYFTLNSDKDIINTYYFDKQKTCLKNFAYLSKHPSGYFFNNILMKKLNINRYSDMSVTGVFPFEFIATDLAKNGNCAILDVSFIKTGSIYKKDNTIAVSGTYSSANKNLFFAPDYRFEQYERYVRHLKSLDLSFIVKLKVFKKLTKQTLIEMTNTFKQIVSNPDMVKYYQVNLQDYSDEKIKADIENKINESTIIKGIYRFILKRKWRKFNND